MTIIEPRASMSKRILGIFVLALGLVGTAHAADLPIKAPDAPTAPSCFSSFWDYLNASVRDCPLLATDRLRSTGHWKAALVTNSGAPRSVRMPISPTTPFRGTAETS